MPAIASFVEERLNLAVSVNQPAIIYNTVGGPQFNTTIVPTGGGHEARRSNWAESRGRWQIGDRLYSKAEWEYLRDFFWARRGSGVGFRFKDWSDFSASSFLGTGDGRNRSFQLVKNYASRDGFSPRKIHKPIASSLRVQLGGIEISSGYSVNTINGIVSFSNPPASGVLVSADFEFDTPVRFESDRLVSRFDAFRALDGEALFYVSSLSVVALKLL